MDICMETFATLIKFTMSVNSNKNLAWLGIKRSDDTMDEGHKGGQVIRAL